MENQYTLEKKNYTVTEQKEGKIYRKREKSLDSRVVNGAICVDMY